MRMWEQGEEEWSGGLTWYEYELLSLNLQTKMKTKMSRKMTIFEKARVGFDFSKNDHFQIILDLIFKSFSKNEIENEPKMSQKWLP